MSAMKDIPVNDQITIQELTENPYPFYRHCRNETPVVRVSSIRRVVLTKAADTRHCKGTPELFSSNDPDTPMKKAFQADTLMRKDGKAHLRERNAWMKTFAPRTIRDVWVPTYQKIAEDYVARLPRGEVVDLFSAIAAPFAARGLANLLGIPKASDDEMRYWSQTLIDGAGNFGRDQALFDKCDAANLVMNDLIAEEANRLRAVPDQSALSVMINADDPIEMSQIISNLKIAIGGGINEPRDALCTVLYGLLNNPDQLAAVKSEEVSWSEAFEEAIRWVAPIQVSSRFVLEDTEIGGYAVKKGEILMTSQASANRDEELYDDPEVFNVFRDNKTHQSFGNGPHHCQGSHLSRKVLPNIILPMLFDRFPNMKLATADDVVWQGFAFRGPINLPVLLE